MNILKIAWTNSKAKKVLTKLNIIDYSILSLIIFFSVTIYNNKNKSCPPCVKCPPCIECPECPECQKITDKDWLKEYLYNQYINGEIAIKNN